MTIGRYEAESEAAEAAELVRRILREGVEPAWLYERNRTALTACAEELETAALSFAADEPIGNES